MVSWLDGRHMGLFLYAHTRHLCVRPLLPRDRRREASSRETVKREGKKYEIRKQEIRCEGNAGRTTSILWRDSVAYGYFTGPGQSISSPSSPSQSRTPHPHINSSSSWSCYRASLLFSHSLPPPAFCDLVAASFAGSRLLLLSGCFPSGVQVSHLHHAHLESAPTQKKKTSPPYTSDLRK